MAQEVRRSNCPGLKPGVLGLPFKNSGCDGGLDEKRVVVVRLNLLD